MYKKEEIKSLIDKAFKINSEIDELEFKEASGGMPKSIWEPISAFSHKPNGGVIVFGIKEDRQTREFSIINDLDIASLQESLTSYLRETIINPGKHQMQIIDYKQKKLLALTIDETPNEKKPCYKESKGVPNGARIRDGNTNRQMTDEEMRAFIRNNSDFSYDKTEAKGTSLNLLSQDKIVAFLKESASRIGRVNPEKDEYLEILKNISIVDTFKDRLKPTIGGFLIFSEMEPQLKKGFSRYQIRCVHYEGVSVTSDIIDKADINGTLDQQIEDINKFILKNIPQRAQIVGTKRIEKYEYPEDAIRELVANAIIHRNYVITETYTQVNIFSNRIEITNPGCLPPGITVNNIKDAQFSRNEVIASILKDLKYLEEYGRGINIVMSRMREYDLPDPIFKNESNKFTVILLGSFFKDLNDRQVKLWSRLQEQQRIDINECQQLFPNVSKQTIHRDLKELINLNLIEKRGASYKTYYVPTH
jgi:ATP-dependent DNA helicase RecG